MFLDGESCGWMNLQATQWQASNILPRVMSQYIRKHMYAPLCLCKVEVTPPPIFFFQKHTCVYIACLLLQLTNNLEGECGAIVHGGDVRFVVRPRRESLPAGLRQRCVDHATP